MKKISMTLAGLMVFFLATPALAENNIAEAPVKKALEDFYKGEKLQVFLADWVRVKKGKPLSLDLTEIGAGTLPLTGTYRAFVWSPDDILHGVCLKYVASIIKHGMPDMGETSRDCPDGTRLANDNGIMLSYGFPAFANNMSNYLQIEMVKTKRIYVVVVRE